MNRIFRIIWSRTLRLWVVTSELATSRGKEGGRNARRTRARGPGGMTFECGMSPWPWRFGAFVALLAAYPSAHATNRYWDINGSTAGQGGTGTWNTTSPFWSPLADGTTGPFGAWSNAALDDAYFAGTAGTVTLGVPITAHSLNFQANGYTITGGTLTLAGSSPTIGYTGANATTINSVLAGSNGLTINGGSTNGGIILGGSNTLTGGIAVNGGAHLTVTGSNGLNGASNVVTVNNGGALQINHSNAFGGNTAAANLVLNNGANLWLGNQNLTHDITATGGTIVIEDPYSGGNSTWTGKLVLTANTTLFVNNTGNGDSTIFAGNLTDTGTNRLSLVMNEGGTIDSNLVLNGTNSFTGGITVNAGSLYLSGNDSAGGAAGNVVTINGGRIVASSNAFGGDTDAAQLIINSGGELLVDTSQTLNHNVTLTGGTAYIDGLGAATWSGTAVLTANTLLRLGRGSNTITVLGPLQDTGANVLSVTTQGGTVRFNGALGFSGDLNLASGNTWFDGGSYTYSGSTIIGNGTGLVLNSTSLSPNSNVRYEGLNNGSVTVIYGTTAKSSITMPNGTGGGQLRWNGTGGFYALNNQSDVTVNLGGADATLTWNDGRFVPTGHALILGTNSVGGDARAVDFQNGIDLSGGLRDVRVDNGNLSDHAKISGVLTGTGGLHVFGNNALELTAANNYSGATVIGDATNDAGYLILANTAAWSPNSNIQINGADGIINGGMVTLTAAYGDFVNALGTGANQVQWTGSGGFGAIGGDRHVNIGGAGATLVWGAGGFVPAGKALRFGGRFTDSTVVWDNGIDLGAADRTINVNEGVNLDRDARLQGIIQGTGGLTLLGQGDVDLFGLNTYSGTTRIGDGSVASDNMLVYFNSLANTGTASSFGAGSTIQLASHNGGIIYTGTGAASGNRNLALAGRNGSLLHLFNRGGGALEISGDIATTTSGAANELRIGGTFVSTDANNDGIAENPNVLSGVISDGAGTTSILGTQCSAGNVWRLSGANTFTGRFNAGGCDWEITSLADAGVASSIGAGSATLTNFDFASANGTVTYIGDGDSTNRLFKAWGNSVFESSGTGAVHFTNTGNILDGNGTWLHWLGGNNTDDNTLAATLVDGLARSAFTSSNFSLGKRGPGLWALVTDNNADARAYSNNTRIAGGALRVDNAGAITGGLGVTSSHGATGSSQRSSLIQFEGAADGTGGVLGLTAASGGFFRGTTTAARAWTNNNGTDVGQDPDGPTGPLPAYGLEALDDDNYVQGVRWTGSGGFAAWNGSQVVNLFGDAREMTWGSGGFVPANQQLVFGYQTADGTVDFQNAVNFGAGARDVRVNDGTAQRDAIMSGVLRSTSALGGLVKSGTGSLTLTANNTYTGTTNVSAGTLEIGNGGTTGSMGTGAQALVAAGATLIANRSNAYALGQAVIGAGTLVQRGTGTTTMTANSNIGHVVLDQGTLVTPATLQTNDVTFTDTGGATLEVTGTLQTSAAGAALVTGGLGSDTVRIDAGATMRANGSLGDGADTLDVAGTLNTIGGTLSLAAGDDRFTIHDGTSVVGTIDGGLGTDTLNADIATTANLGALLNFETLDKNGAGTLNITGPGTSDFGTVNVNAGTLNVAAGAAVAAPATGAIGTTVAAGATLNVNGAFGCGNGADTITIAGNVTGSGTIDQCGGDDLLTLRSGANVSGYTGVFNGGAGNDTVQLDVATTLDFAQGTVTNYENLLKTNVGIATLNGNHAYGGGTTIAGGTLDVNGSLATPSIAMTNTTGTTSLNVDGVVQTAAATQVAITGSAGTNVVNVNSGASLLASGSLGDGNDTLDVAGTLDTGAGSFDLGNGDDTFVIHDNTHVAGTVLGGAGTDSLTADIAATADLGTGRGFEVLTKRGAGTLNVQGPGTSDFGVVNIDAGTLHVASGASVGAPATGTLATTIAGGAVLDVVAGGAYGCGNGADTLTVAGTISGAGTVDQCGGDDTLVLNDGASLALAGPVSGGTQATGDTVVLNNALAMTLDGSAIVDYEFLVKNQAGIASLTGTQTYSGGTTINDGTLRVDGSVSTPTIDMTNATGSTTLDVAGTVQGNGVPQTVITGGAGANVVTVGAGGMLLATGTLGAGNDTLDVAGTLDTGAGVFDLGDGDDTFIVHDGSVVSGTVVGGAGVDTRVYDLAGTANVGALQQFEGLTKRGAGTLNLTGPTASELVDVRVEGGTLNVQAGSTVVAQAGSALDTTVLAGATLHVDGSYAGSALSDTMDVAGTISGSGTINLADGDDTLVLHDDADLSGLLNPIDGGAHGAGDTVALDISGNYTFADSQTVNFEILTKQNTGTATLTGTQHWNAVNIAGGTLAVDAGATLSAPSLSMADDTVFHVAGAAGGDPALTTPMTITGSAGVNTVTVAGGGTLHAAGSLGDGNDVLDVAGTLDTSGGVFDLGAGDDRFVIHDTTAVLGAVDGGAGNDMLDVNVGAGNTVPLGSLLGFESLGKSGLGTLQINGPSSFIDVDLQGGTLDVAAGGSVTAQTTTVAAGSTLRLSGTYSGTGGDDTMVVAGTVTGSGTLGLGDGNDSFTVQDGADLSGLANPVDGGAGTDTFVADLAGNAILGGAINFETLSKTNTGTLTVAGPAMSAFSTVNVLGGMLNIGIAGSLTNVQTLTVDAGTSLNVDGAVLFTPGADSFTVAGNVGGVGTIDMLGGDDTLTLRDGANLAGLAMPVNGGAGNDTVVADIAGSATLSAVTQFEALTKTNAGVLHVDGPAPSDFATVNVGGGTLDIGTGGSIGGVTTTTVAAGATLNVDGSYAGSSGADTMDVSGAITGAGSIAFGDGDDRLILHDADLSGFTGVLDGGAGIGTDTVVLDNARDATFGANAVIGFESLVKQNTGTATLAGNHAYSAGTDVLGGGLVVAGRLTTPQLSMADDTALTVHGALDGGAGTATVITGSAGVNTVAIDGTALANGDLGAGDDVLDVAGTLDTGGGVFGLGDGNDNFVVHDGTVVTGTVDGGAGLDTRTYDINTTANLGALVNFEGVTKTGTGTLNITGPGATDLQQVQVLGGILNVGPSGNVVAMAGSTLDTVVAAGATLNVDGSYGCGDGADTMTVAGTVSGSGTIDLCGGDDTLTLKDGAVLAATISGGGHDAGDTVVLDNAGALSFDASRTVNFEFLRKTNTGEATLTGNQAFSGGTSVEQGTLSVTGALQTPAVALSDDTVLHVAGTLQGMAGGTAALAGSAGVNTVTVDAGATLRASGDLGAGDDVLDLAGTLDTGGGVLSLGDGSDMFVVHDTTAMVGTVDGGAGNDMLNVNVGTGHVVPLGGMLGFESLGKSGEGTLQINGPSTFIDVAVTGGLLQVGAGGSVAAQHTYVASGTALQVDGAFTGTDGDDLMELAGKLSGSGTMGLGNGNDSLVLMEGADMSGLARPLDGGAGTDTIQAQVNGAMALGPTVNFESLTKGGNGTLTVAASQAFDTTSVGQGTLVVASGATLTSRTTTVDAGSTLQVDGLFTSPDTGASTFVSMGTVKGALAFGSGSTTAHFIGGDLSGLTRLDGGSGHDVLQFSGLDLGDANLAPISHWERIELLDNSNLTQSSPFDLGGGTLFIDSTSQWAAQGGARLGGNVENAGVIQVGANRVPISGNYTGSGGQLRVTVSPANGTSGGLDIAGQVSGRTGIVFASDGTEATQPTHIKVVSAPNAPSDAFVPVETKDGAIRLDGSPYPWTFGRNGSGGDWYLNTEAAGLLPEMPAYGLLPALGALLAQQSDDVVHQRLSGIRDTGLPECGRDTQRRYDRAGMNAGDDCHGLWVAVTASGQKLGANPGFKASGSDVGVYAGVDRASWESDSITSRGGAYVGVTHGNYWTTGANSSALQGTGEAGIRLDSPVVGLYGSLEWTNGAHVDAVMNSQRSRARVHTGDTFAERLNGNSQTLSVSAGRRWRLASGWMLEPQVGLSASRVNWSDKTDSAGRQLVFDNSWVSTASAGLRVERTFETGGATIRPWLDLTMLRTFHQPAHGLQIAQSGGNGALTLPVQDLGTRALLNAGVEATLNANVSLFGVLSVDRELRGSDYSRHAANVGVRVRW
jgi:fibronectin-binding autotransporter adhesin